MELCNLWKEHKYYNQLQNESSHESNNCVLVVIYFRGPPIRLAQTQGELRKAQPPITIKFNMFKVYVFGFILTRASPWFKSK